MTSPDPSQALAIDACELDPEAAMTQGRRYAALAADVEGASRRTGELVIRFADDADLGLVDEAVTVERSCCTFFEIDWDPGSRVLRFAVANGGQDVALDAIAESLGVGEADAGGRFAAGGRPPA